MSIQFWYQYRVWQKWYQSCVNHRNASLVRTVISLVLFWVFAKIFWSLLSYPFIISAFWFITHILNGYLLLLSFSFLDGQSEAFGVLARGSPSGVCTSEKVGWWIECWIPRKDSSELTQVERLQPRTTLCQHMGTYLRKCPCMVCASDVVWEEIELRVCVVPHTYHAAP
jgi:hypothetical protein